MKNTSTYLAEIFMEGGITKFTRVHRVLGLNKNNEPQTKRVDARKFSRQVKKSQLVTG